MYLAYPTSKYLFDGSLVQGDGVQRADLERPMVLLEREGSGVGVHIYSVITDRMTDGKIDHI